MTDHPESLVSARGPRRSDPPGRCEMSRPARPPFPEHREPRCVAPTDDLTTEIGDPCRICDHRKSWGRGDANPVHCRHCHNTWTGVEAQHCVTCHHTFASIDAADRHRWKRPKGEPNGECLDPCADDRWHQKRPGVWTTGRRPEGIHQ